MNSDLISGDFRASDPPPAMPPTGVDQWNEMNDGDTLISGDFKVVKIPSGASVAWFCGMDLYDRTPQRVGLGEHPSVRGAISACREVASALQSARRHGQVDMDDLQKDPEPDPPLRSDWAEKYARDILSRSKQSHGRER